MKIYYFFIYFLYLFSTIEGTRIVLLNDTSQFVQYRNKNQSGCLKENQFIHLLLSRKCTLCVTKGKERKVFYIIPPRHPQDLATISIKPIPLPVSQILEAETAPNKCCLLEKIIFVKYNH